MFSPQESVAFYIGTMGFSYQEWSRVFYPTKMKAKKFLAHYSRIFNSVEIDSTFYGTPRADTVRRWGMTTPKNFKFCLKVPRSITHMAGLVGVEEELNNILPNGKFARG